MIMKTLRRACGSLAPTCNILDRPFRRNQILDFANTTKALSRQACTKSFDPRSYAPDDRFSSDNVGTLLRKSILNQIPVDEAKARIELAACYRLFELAGWVLKPHRCRKLLHELINALFAEREYLQSFDSQSNRTKR